MDDRLDHLMSGYGCFSHELQRCAEKIRKRFGPDRTKNFLLLLENENCEKQWLVLQYYDKGYLHGLSKRESVHVHRVPVVGLNHRQVASDVMDFSIVFSTMSFNVPDVKSSILVALIVFLVFQSGLKNFYDTPISLFTC